MELVTEPRGQSSVVRALLRMTWPLVLSQLITQLDSIAVRYWLGHYHGKEGIAVHTATAQPVNLLTLLLIGIVTGQGVAVARSVGARDGRGMTLTANAATLTLLVSLVLAGVVIGFGDPMASAIAKEGVPETAVHQFLVSYVVLTVPVISLASVITTAGISAGWTRFALMWGVTHVPPVFVMLPLTLGPLDLGYYGPAVAGAIASVINCVTLWWLLRRRAVSLNLGATIDTSHLFDRGLWRDLIAVGYPQQLSRAAMWAVTMTVMFHVRDAGMLTLAGYGIAMAFVDLMGFATGGYARAAAIMIGMSLGAKDPARARLVLRKSLSLGLVLSGTVVLLLEIGAPVAARFFSDDPAVIEEGTRALRLMCMTLLPAAAWQVLLGAFGAARATMRPFMVTLVIQAIAFGFIVFVWNGDAVLGAFTTLGSMYVVCLAAYLGLAVPILWRGALAVPTSKA